MIRKKSMISLRFFIMCKNIIRSYFNQEDEQTQKRNDHVNFSQHVKMSEQPTGNDEFNFLVEKFKDLKLSNKTTTVIRSPYPGAFYKKIYDDEKIKVFERNGHSKVYVYPSFKPRVFESKQTESQNRS